MRYIFSFGIFVLFAANQSFQLSLNHPQHKRIARSYYGGYESVLPPITAPAMSYGSTISKDELIALLEAYKEVEQADKPQEQAPAAPAAPAAAPEQPPAAADPGTPLTLSLPAFVPIQLSAMYAAPAAPAAQAAPAPAKPPAAEPAAPEPEREPEAPASGGGDSHDTLLRLLKAKFVGQKPVSPILASPVVREIPAVTRTVTRIINPVKVTRYISDYPPVTRIYTSPPSFLGHGPTVLRLVPSSSLLSNWR